MFIELNSEASSDPHVSFAKSSLEGVDYFFVSTLSQLNVKFADYLVG